MPRNGTGTYTPPAGQPVVSGTTVLASTFNALVTDVGTELTKSISTDGQTPMAAALPMGGNKITGLAAGALASDAARFDQVTVKVNTSDLIATTGAGLVGAADGSSGTLFSTVAGFIAKVLSSTGASLMGWIQAGAGAVQRTAQDKLRELFSSGDFYTGDIGTAINLAIASLPATGGVIDCRWMRGSYATATTIVCDKPVQLLLGAATITFSVNPAIDHTGKNLTISGAGDQMSILASSSNGHLIYSHGVDPQALDMLTVENVGFIDMMTVQPGPTFGTWASTRTAGAAIFVNGTSFISIKNCRTFGFFDGLRLWRIIASTVENVKCRWSARDSFNLGYNSTSVTVTGCYSFAPQRDGYHIEDNFWYSTFNSPASDSAGRHGYYLGPGVNNALSPYGITFNSPGCEQAGTRLTNSASMVLDGVRDIILNTPIFTGIPQATLANTVDGLRAENASGSRIANVTINQGIFGTALSNSSMGGYGINIPAGIAAGKITVVAAPSDIVGVVGSVFDPDGRIEYLQGTSGSYVGAANATAVKLTTLPNVTGGAWLITTWVSLGSASAWVSETLILTELASSSLTVLKAAGGGIVISMSGLDVMCTQSNGSTQTIFWSMTRMAMT